MVRSEEDELASVRAGQEPAWEGHRLIGGGGAQLDVVEEEGFHGLGLIVQIQYLLILKQERTQKRGGALSGVQVTHAQQQMYQSSRTPAINQSGPETHISEAQQRACATAHIPARTRHREDSGTGQS